MDSEREKIVNNEAKLKRMKQEENKRIACDRAIYRAEKASFNAGFIEMLNVFVKEGMFSMSVDDINAATEALSHKGPTTIVLNSKDPDYVAKIKLEFLENHTVRTVIHCNELFRNKVIKKLFPEIVKYIQKRYMMCFNTSNIQRNIMYTAGVVELVWAYDPELYAIRYNLSDIKECAKGRASLIGVGLLVEIDAILECVKYIADSRSIRGADELYSEISMLSEQTIS